MLSHTCPMVNLDKCLLKCLVTFESSVLHDQTLISFYRGALLSEDTFPTSRNHLTEGAYACLQEILAGLMAKAASSPSGCQSDEEIHPTDEKTGSMSGRGPGATERAEETEEMKKKIEPPLGDLREFGTRV